MPNFVWQRSFSASTNSQLLFNFFMGNKVTYFLLWVASCFDPYIRNLRFKLRVFGRPPYIICSRILWSIIFGKAFVNVSLASKEKEKGVHLSRMNEWEIAVGHLHFYEWHAITMCTSTWFMNMIYGSLNWL